MHRFFSSGWFLAFIGLLVGAGAARGASFSFASTAINIVAVPDADHAALEVPFTVQAGFNAATLTCASDANWVTPAIDASTNVVRLTFKTATLISRTNTASVTVTDGVTPVTLFVKATVSVVNIVTLQADPTRSRVYGLQQDGINAGAVVIFDPLAGRSVASVTVGNKPTDLAVSADGAELLVICSASKQIYAIDLQKLGVKETLTLPGYQDWGVDSTSAHVAYGPGNTIYFVDGAWAPTLRVLNRATRLVTQTLQIGKTSDFGFGDIAVSRDNKYLYGWAQYGWSAGSTTSFAARYAIKADGTLTYEQEGSGLSRDPLNTPALVSYDGSVVVLKQYVFGASDVASPLQSTPTPVFAITPGAEILSTATALYQRSTGNKVLDLPVSTSVQAITADYSRLVYFNPTTHALGTVNLTASVGEAVLGLQRFPAEGGIVLSPAKLQWSPVPGVNRYRVYLGSDRAAVAQATTASATYLGEVTQPSIDLTTALTPGVTYYWRVDSVTANETVTGGVFSFVVSSISSDTAAIDVATVQAHRNYAVPIALSSATAGKAWSASSAASWISFSASNGVTPSTLTVSFDATKLSPGVSTSSVTITTPDGPFTIPVTLRVDPLKLTLLKSRISSTTVYGISEDTTATSPRAYLLEIDTLARAVNRVVRVGSSVTDLAVHEKENRIYVTNWQSGALLAVNQGTFAVTRTYNFTPAAPTGYGNNDVYRVSPGAAGRLVIEEEDQWIDLSIFDTTTGKVVGTAGGVREGGGATDSIGRYYYHGDNNISDASLHRYELVGDKFTDLGKKAVSGISYYGTRTVLVSEDDKRVFWNGAAFTATLGVEWLIGDEIFSISRDGRYAFSKTRIYDVETHELVGSMPVSTAVSAFNSTTGLLVVQNGTTIAYYNVVGQGLFGNQMSPVANAIVLAPAELKWSAIPGIGSYQVYLGTSLAAVTAATPASPEFQGNVGIGRYAPSAPLVSGTTYYWRIDPVTLSGPVKGDVAQFTVAAIAPTVSTVAAATVRSDPGYGVAIGLSSATNGLGWTASSPASWVKFAAAAGTTPAVLQLQLDASALAPGVYETTVSVAAAGGGFTLPLSLRVDPLNVTVMRSDPASAKVYAVSEETVSTGIGRAYLLELDAAQQRITRVASAGGSVTDIAIHAAENRVYVTNWRIGALLAFNRDTMVLARTYAVPAFSSYPEGDVYRIAAGSAGRLILEEEDQWIDISIFDTVAGAVLAKAFVREGGGSYSPDLRFYYHGENNSSGAMLRKFDTVGDVFTTAGAVSPPAGSNSGYGSRTVVMSEDGKRVFWAGGVFSAQLGVEWASGEVINSASATGRFAASNTKIYDVDQRKAIFAMPVNTAVSAFNTRAGKLVLQKDQQLAYYTVDPTVPLPTPELAAGPLAASSVPLTWKVEGLQSGFTLQMRLRGASQWTDVTATLGASARAFTVSQLAAGANYEFRVKADATATSSAWSNVVGVAMPAAAQVTANIAAADGVSLGAKVSLSVAGASGGTYTWARNGTIVSGSGSTLTLDVLQPANAGLYSAATSGSTVGQPAIVGLASTVKTTTGGQEIGADIAHPNGNVYDQVLLKGSAVAVTSDAASNQVTRTSFIDLNDDIVQVEFSGPGTLTLVLDTPSGPALPVKYNQSVSYMRGHAGIIITGANENTNVSVFSVGRLTAFDPTGAFDILQPISATNDPANNGSPLFTGRAASTYDGMADIAFIAIASTNGRFGGVRTANASYFATRGITGLYAPGVAFTGPVLLGDVNAIDNAQAMLVVGSAADARIAGGDLLQTNGRPIQAAGLTRLAFTAGVDSHGRALSAKTNRGVIIQAGDDVTATVVNPTP